MQQFQNHWSDSNVAAKGDSSDVKLESQVHSILFSYEQVTLQMSTNRIETNMIRNDENPQTSN